MGYLIFLGVSLPSAIFSHTWPGGPSLDNCDLRDLVQVTIRALGVIYKRLRDSLDCLLLFDMAV